MFKNVFLPLFKINLENVMPKNNRCMGDAEIDMYTCISPNLRVSHLPLTCPSIPVPSHSPLS